MDYQRLYEYRFRNIDQSTRRGSGGRSPATSPSARWGARVACSTPPPAGASSSTAPTAEEKWAVDRVDYGEAVAGSGTRLIISDVMEAELPADYFDGIFVSNSSSTCRRPTLSTSSS